MAENRDSSSSVERESNAPVGRFVCQDQTWVGDKRPCHGGTLFLTAGYLIGKFLQQFCNAQLLRNGCEPALHLRIRRSGQHQRQIDVVLQGKGVQQVEVLEHKAQVVPAKCGDL